MSFFLSLTVITMLIMLVCYPERLMDSAYRAISVCITSVIPSLFLSVVLTKIIVSSDFIFTLTRPFGKAFRSLTGLPQCGVSVYLLSFLSGFPSGVIAGADLYKRGVLSKKEAERLIAISNNTGPFLPMLLLGRGIFGSVSSGVIIYLIQIASSLICAITFKESDSRKADSPLILNNRVSIVSAVTSSVEGALRSMAMLCAYVIIFSCINDLPFLSSGIFTCIKPYIELVSGSLALNKSGFGASFVIVCSAMSFGGLSVHFQALGVVSDCKLSLSLHLRAKALQGFVSLVLSLCYLFVMSLR